jgi:hypothetical protein
METSIDLEGRQKMTAEYEAKKAKVETASPPEPSDTPPTPDTEGSSNAA